MNYFYFLKIVITVIFITAISEVSKKSSIIAAVMASLPVISIIAMMWIYIDTKDIEKISLLSKQLSWMVLPSLIFFISLPIFLKHGFSFYSGLTSSMILTATGYCAMILIIKQIGFKI
ncbi:DUF3147 family protein [Syntrophus aciditrophicus]|uniref:Hypothetical membrane protein n=1 Tax=Syntrophus aciditrophicus (strain SB) TaxID=56780 RepID=Q2LVA1_SYNAS|nr:DUF3147 family protein [Syntrophus aciditrophicus]ABC78008.1 hypothetical membrane protein [Syntrophus aciditrophicus SB]